MGTTPEQAARSVRVSTIPPAPSRAGNPGFHERVITPPSGFRSQPVDGQGRPEIADSPWGKQNDIVKAVAEKLGAEFPEFREDIDKAAEKATRNRDRWPMAEFHSAFTNGLGHLSDRVLDLFAEMNRNLL